MKTKMRKCSSCDLYTIKRTCLVCGCETRSVHPPKYSIEDKYGKYRRKLKEMSLKSNLTTK